MSDMSRETFFSRMVKFSGIPMLIEASIQFDENNLGTVMGNVTPWAISINTTQDNSTKDIGRLVGFEGDAPTVISMHHLKPDPDAGRGFEITVFRVSDALRESKADLAIFAALERWLLKRGWRGNFMKRMKFTDPAWVVPIRQTWIRLGFELILEQEGQWDEHVVKRWRSRTRSDCGKNGALLGVGGLYTPTRPLLSEPYNPTTAK